MALNIVQIIIALLLIVTILLQQRGSGLSSAFGGGGGGVYYQKRGMEKILFRSSIALAALFIIVAFLNLLQ